MATSFVSLPTQPASPCSPSRSQASSAKPAGAATTSSWSPTKTVSAAGSEGLFGAAFLSTNLGVVVGGDYQQKRPLDPAAARTTDGGKTWQPVALWPAGFYSGITVVPGAPHTLVATGLAGTSFSTDDGVTWTPADQAPLHAAAFAELDVGYGVGARGLIVKWTPPPTAQSK